MQINENREFSTSILTEIQNLLEHYTGRQTSFNAEDFNDLVNNKNTFLFTVSDPSQNDRIAGMLTLNVYKIPTGQQAHIDDMVVHSDYRRQGLGKLLIQEALVKCNSMGVVEAGLTTNPDREAANRFYLEMGFKRRQTNVYSMKFK